MRLGAIYGLKDPRTPWRIYYVGSTIDVMVRLNGHIIALEQGRGHSVGMRRWLQALKKAGHVPQLEVLEGGLPEEHLSTYEDNWIILMASFFPLLNRGNTYRKPAKR